MLYSQQKLGYVECHPFFLIPSAQLRDDGSLPSRQEHLGGRVVRKSVESNGKVAVLVQLINEVRGNRMEKDD